MQQGRSDATYDIKSQKPFGTPVVFQDASEHPKDQHIPEYMPEPPVQKHVGNDLVRLEKRRTNIMKSKKVVHPSRSPGRKCELIRKTINIDNDQVLYYWRYYRERPKRKSVILLQKLMAAS